MKFLITFLTSALLCLGAGGDANAAEHGTREEAIALIEKTAAHLIDEGPEKTFFEVSNPKGRFTYRDLYIAIYDLHGKVMAHGALPRLVGINIYDYRDDDDKYYVREILDRAGKGQQGPVDYKWIDPATRQMQVKSAYFRQVGLYVISASTFR